NWYFDECNQLRREVREGKSIEEIAKIHQREENAIKHKLITLRINPPKGLTLEQKLWIIGIIVSIIGLMIQYYK
ncbi:MAG: hypothetical protein Q7U60_05405, partial [Candidatus Methanoperedens sp.]|nr:hypothetical protein [Candidatus Methanoperedens sp.]